MNISKLYGRYAATPGFKNLSENSVHSYRKSLRTVSGWFGDQDIRTIKRQDILAFRDAHAHKPGVANNGLRLISILLNHAEDREWIEESPYRRIKKVEASSLCMWSRHDLMKIDKLDPEARKTVVLCLHTGQRFGDVVRLKWSDIKGELGKKAYFEIEQQKTKEPVHLPISKQLAAYLFMWKRLYGSKGTIIGVSEAERSDTVRERVRRHLRQVGITGTLHGLRYTALTRLAEVGCTPHEIQAISGHRTLAMVTKYTKQVERKGLANRAIERIDNATG